MTLIQPSKAQSFTNATGITTYLPRQGGVSTGWQLAMRSKDVYGPYEEKIVLEQGGSETNGPHQGAWVKRRKANPGFITFRIGRLMGALYIFNPWVERWLASYR
ncbi:MAG: hypothetical protein R2778_10260 [Saprospiraceae bacterium]